jgi:hypothetical protein
MQQPEASRQYRRLLKREITASDYSRTLKLEARAEVERRRARARGARDQA